MIDGFGVERLDIVSKAEQKEASTGRLITGTVFGPYHGLAAGKKGRKLRAAGNELGGSLVGGAAGSAAGSLPGLIARKPGLAIHGSVAGSTVGGYAGKWQGTKRAQRMGHYKPER